MQLNKEPNAWAQKFIEGADSLLHRHPRLCVSLNFPASNRLARAVRVW